MTKTWSRAALAALVGALVLGRSASLVLAATPAPWIEPVKPFRIAPTVYYVGTKGLSAYLIGSPRGAILLDGTMQQNAPLIERSIEEVGVPLKAVKIIVSDHAHHDHVGAIAAIKADTGATFAASAGDAPALRKGWPPGEVDYQPTGFPPIAVDRIVGDGETVRAGDAVLTAHLTPGHTPGCTSWSADVRDGNRSLRILFLCSITVAGNKLVGNHAYPEIVSDYEKTFTKLGAMQADIVLTSHPEVADVLGREGRVERGDKNAFIDRTELAEIVAHAKADFETGLAKAKAANP